VLRLEQVFEMIDKKAQGKKCRAIDGIIEEGQEVAKEYKGSPALDSGLLAAAQAVEYYEISRYGTLRTWAQELGLKKAVQLLETTLKEEKNTDETLTELAETCVNQEGQEHPHGNRGCGLDHSQHEDDEKGPEGDENGAGMAPRKGCRRLHLFLRSSCVPFRTSRKDPISISVNSHHRLWAWLEFAALYRLCAGDYVSGMGRARN
jgi:hypothetical protein